MPKSSDLGLGLEFVYFKTRHEASNDHEEGVGVKSDGEVGTQEEPEEAIDDVDDDADDKDGVDGFVGVVAKEGEYGDEDKI